jgi:hypothetical protein
MLLFLPSIIEGITDDKMKIQANEWINMMRSILGYNHEPIEGKLLLK